MNVALNKNIKENNWKRAEILTNGKVIGYTGYEGFAHAKWPTYLTLDLLFPYSAEALPQSFLS